MRFKALSNVVTLYRMRYIPSQGYSDPPGVTVTVPDFGSVSSIEFVGPYPFYNNIVEYLIKRGYIRDVNIRAAPYDWRLNPGKSYLLCTE